LQFEDFGGRFICGLGGGEESGGKSAEGGAYCEGDSCGAGFGEGKRCCAAYALGGAGYEDVVASVIRFRGPVDSGVVVGVGNAEGFSSVGECGRRKEVRTIGNGLLEVGRHFDGC
jgi:hypothetical protein